MAAERDVPALTGEGLGLRLGSMPQPLATGSALKIRGGMVAVAYSYETAIRRRLLKRVSCRADVDDVFQDFLLRIFRCASGAEVEHPFGYLLTVLESTLRDRHRRQNARPHTRSVPLEDHLLIAEQPSPETEALYGQQVRLLAGALAQLKPKSRRALLLHRLEGLTYEQIALELKISVSMVQKHISRASRFLRNLCN